MASNFLAGLGGFLSGGLNAYNAATAADEERAQREQQLALQQEQLRRAIANDERIAANQEAQLEQQRQQQKSLDDQRLFQQSESVVKSGYKGALTPEMAAKLHPTHRALAVEEIPRGALDSLPQFGTQNLDGSLNAPPDPNAPPGLRFRESESERMEIARINAAARAADAAARNGFNERKLAQDRDIAMQRIMASILNAQANGRGGRPTGAQQKDLTYFNRMVEAERAARAVENDVTNWDLGVNEMSPGFLENWLQSPKGQQYTQAQRAFAEARLRRESGAAINQSEFDINRRVYFRNSGDDPAGFANKRKQRMATLRGMAYAAGPALQEYYGPEATLDSVLAEFADQQAAAGVPGGGAAPVAGAGTTSPAPSSDYQRYLQRKGIK